MRRADRPRSDILVRLAALRSKTALAHALVVEEVEHRAGSRSKTARAQGRITRHNASRRMASRRVSLTIPNARRSSFAFAACPDDAISESALATSSRTQVGSTRREAITQANVRHAS